MKKPKKTAAAAPRHKKATSGKVPNWFVITEVAQLKSVAHPLRLKILAEFADEPRTTKQVAERLGEPPTRLYHHVDALAECGLLVLREEIPKRGTVEKYFQAVAKQFRVGTDCLSQSQFAGQKEKALVKLLDTTRTGLLDSFVSVPGDLESDPFESIAVGGLVQATAAEMADISESLIAQLNKSSKQKMSRSKKTKTPTKGAKKYRIAIFIYEQTED